MTNRIKDDVQECLAEEIHRYELLAQMYEKKDREIYAGYMCKVVRLRQALQIVRESKEVPSLWQSDSQKKESLSHSVLPVSPKRVRVERFSAKPSGRKSST